jgi:hypothetical protein
MPANTPPANDPLIEQIAGNLVSTIDGIAALHLAEGGFYFADYKAERPHPGSATDFVDGRVQIAQGLFEGDEDIANTCSLGIRTYFTCRIDCVVPQRGTESLDRKLNLRAADVIKAVLKDIQRGGIALGTDFAYADAPEGTPDQTKGRVDLVFTVQHQQSRNDPTAF